MYCLLLKKYFFVTFYNKLFNNVTNLNYVVRGLVKKVILNKIILTISSFIEGRSFIIFTNFNKTFYHFYKNKKRIKKKIKKRVINL